MEKSASEVRQNTCILKENHILCNTLCSVASQVDLSFKQVKNTNSKLFKSYFWQFWLTSCIIWEQVRQFNLLHKVYLNI